MAGGVFSMKIYIKKSLVFIFYLAMLVAVVVFFSGNGQFIYEGF